MKVAPAEQKESSDQHLEHHRAHHPNGMLRTASCQYVSRLSRDIEGNSILYIHSHTDIWLQQHSYSPVVSNTCPSESTQRLLRSERTSRQQPRNIHFSCSVYLICGYFGYQVWEMISITHPQDDGCHRRLKKPSKHYGTVFTDGVRCLHGSAIYQHYKNWDQVFPYTSYS